MSQRSPWRTSLAVWAPRNVGGRRVAADPDLDVLGPDLAELLPVTRLEGRTDLVDDPLAVVGPGTRGGRRGPLAVLGELGTGVRAVPCREGLDVRDHRGPDRGLVGGPAALRLRRRRGGRCAAGRLVAALVVAAAGGKRQPGHGGEHHDPRTTPTPQRTSWHGPHSGGTGARVNTTDPPEQPALVDLCRRGSRRVRAVWGD